MTTKHSYSEVLSSPSTPTIVQFTGARVNSNLAGDNGKQSSGTELEIPKHTTTVKMELSS